MFLNSPSVFTNHPLVSAPGAVWFAFTGTLRVLLEKESSRGSEMGKQLGRKPRCRIRVPGATEPRGSCPEHSPCSLCFSVPFLSLLFFIILGTCWVKRARQKSAGGCLLVRLWQPQVMTTLLRFLFIIGPCFPVCPRKHLGSNLPPGF